MSRTDGDDVRLRLLADEAFHPLDEKVLQRAVRPAQLAVCGDSFSVRPNQPGREPLHLQEAQTAHPRVVRVMSSHQAEAHRCEQRAEDDEAARKTFTVWQNETMIIDGAAKVLACCENSEPILSSRNMVASAAMKLASAGWFGTYTASPSFAMQGAHNRGRPALDGGE